MRSLKRFRNRAQRCFELAFLAMMREPAAEKFTLVHGTIRSAHFGSVVHAWIEIGDGRIWDPVTDVYMPTDEYLKKHGAVVERRYTRAEAARMQAANPRCALWHRSDGAVLGS